MKIGVYGSAEGGDEKAKKIGKRIAELGHEVITGGCTGLPYEASKEAKDNGGRTIAFSPAVDLEEHKQKYGLPEDAFSEFRFISRDFIHAGKKDVCLKHRNVLSVAESDAVIIIGGRVGTMNEFTISYDLGKKIGILKNSGGITNESIKTLLKEANKESKAEIIWEEDPVRLVGRILEE